MYDKDNSIGEKEDKWNYTITRFTYEWEKKWKY